MPAFKDLVLRSIASCTNNEQLKVAWTATKLFHTMFEDIVPPLQLYGHTRELQDTYFRKENSLTLLQVY